MGANQMYARPWLTYGVLLRIQHSGIVVIMNGTWHAACVSAFNSPSVQQRVHGSGGVTVSAARFSNNRLHVDVSVRRLQLMLFVQSSALQCFCFGGKCPKTIDRGCGRVMDGSAA